MSDSFSCDSSSAANGTDDREARSKFWIAAYCRPKSEKKAAAELADIIGIDTYAPTQTVVKQWSDRKKKVEEVVIPMIVFAEVSTEQQILAIKKHPLILKILSMPGRNTPARIPGKQIEQLKLMLDQSDEPVEFVQGDFKEFDKVRVIRGHLAGLEGVVQKTADGDTFIIIAIDMLGGSKASVNPSDIQLIQEQK